MKAVKLFEMKSEFFNSKSFFLGNKEMSNNQKIDWRNKFKIVLVPIEI